MNLIHAAKMDRRSISVASLGEEVDDVRYWRTKSPEERLAAIELMRQINYGIDATTGRLQRVLEVAQRASR